MPPLTSRGRPAHPFTGARVLRAEDSPTNQRIGVIMLEKLGCRVDVVADGADAVQALAAAPYDVVFLDCQMPNMDGYAATGEIRRREAAGGARSRTGSPRPCWARRRSMRCSVPPCSGIGPERGGR